jgi:hypothetical protein
MNQLVSRVFEIWLSGRRDKCGWGVVPDNEEVSEEQDLLGFIRRKVVMGSRALRGDMFTREDMKVLRFHVT